MKNIQEKTVSPLLCILATGVVVAPIQSALAHSVLELSLSDFSSKVQSEQHTPHFHVSPNDHYYADPRSLRAVGYDTGKSSDRGKFNRENWEFYVQRMA
jgi:hypothetical protein